MKLKAIKIAELILGISIFFVIGMGMLQYVIGDQSLYASISKTMFNTGNYFDLFLVGEPYYQKPHLPFWLSCISYSIFGVNTFAFKLPYVIIALLGVLGVYKIGTFIHNKTVGFWSAFMWLFSLAFILHQNDIHMDTMMSGFIIWAVYYWAKYLKLEKAKYFYLGCIPLAMAVMTKGPLGAFVPATGFIFGLLYKFGLKGLLKKELYIGAVLTILMISPVLYGVYQQHGVDGLRFFFWENNAGRVDRGESNFWDKDFFFYIHSMLWFFVPWSLASFYALYFVIKNTVKRKAKATSVFLFFCFFVFFAIASVSDGNAPHYIFTLLPFVAVLTSLILVLDKEKLKVGAVLVAIPCVLLFIAIVAIIVLFPPSSFLLVLLLAALLIAAVIILKNTKQFTRYAMLSGIFITMLFAVINFEVFDNFLKPFDAIVEATKQFDEETTGEELWVYDNNNHHPARANFYSTTQLIKRPLSFDEIPFNNKPIWVLVSEKDLEQVLEVDTPKKQYEYEYLLMTRPFESFKHKFTKGNKVLPKYYLMYFQ